MHVLQIARLFHFSKSNLSRHQERDNTKVRLTIFQDPFSSVDLNWKITV